MGGYGSCVMGNPSSVLLIQGWRNSWAVFSVMKWKDFLMSIHGIKPTDLHRNTTK